MKKLYKQKIDEFNKIYKNKRNGKLTFIECSKRDRFRREYIFKCKCDCGNITEVRKRHFNKNGTKSCGCIKKGRPKLKKGEYALNKFINAYKMSAKRRNIKYELTKDQVKNICKQNCYYCGVEPEKRFGRKFTDLYGDFYINGMDRYENDKGYTIENVVPCCKICNRAKNNLDPKTFFEWIERLKNEKTN